MDPTERLTYSSRRCVPLRAAGRFLLSSAFAIAVVFSLLATPVVHQNGPSSQKEPHSDSLVVFPSASEIKFMKFQGTDQVTYKVQTTYPADEVISFISMKLRRQGWRPLREDYLNPGLPTSHVRGWTEFRDMTTHPETDVHQWLAQWDNKAGDVAWYTLRYRYPEGKSPDLNTLLVSASYIPSKIAKAMKEDAERSRRSKH